MGRSPTQNLTPVQKMGDLGVAPPKFTYEERVQVEPRPTKGPSLPHGIGQVCAIYEGPPHTYYVHFAVTSSSLEFEIIEEEYLSKLPTGRRSRSKNNTQQQHQPMPKKQQPAQQLTEKRKDGTRRPDPAKKQKVADKEKSAAKEEEKKRDKVKLAQDSTAQMNGKGQKKKQTAKRNDRTRRTGPVKKPNVADMKKSAAKEEKRVNNNKLARGSTARAAETEEKVRRNSGDSQKEKQLASTTTRKTANWSDKFKKPPPGKSPAHRRWTKKACCGHGGDILKSNWYYGVEGVNDSWQLFLCIECFGKIMEDIKSNCRDVEKYLDYKPICNGKEVSFKRGQEGGTLQKMSLSDFNKMEPK
jgi:hypothetical protein